MPIYEYTCAACAHRADILHGINEPPPGFCPSCGAEGTLRKGFAPPAIVFKGSGWAKKDRSTSRSSAAKDGAGEKAPAGDAEGSGSKPEASAPSTTAPSGGPSPD